MAMNSGTAAVAGRRHRRRPVMAEINVTPMVDVMLVLLIKELVPKLKAITEARGGAEERIFVRGDRQVDYGTVMKVMGQISAAGFRRVALVTESEQQASAR